MTSIAAYLASLAGGAPQEGAKASQAAASGAGGLFAALLSSAEGELSAGAGLETGDFPLGLLAEKLGANAQGTDADIEAILTEIAGNDPQLSALLSQGLAQAEGEVEAEIVGPSENTGQIAKTGTPVIAVETSAAVSTGAQAGAEDTGAEAQGQTPEATAVVPGATPNDVPAPVENSTNTAPAAASAGANIQAEAQVRNRGLDNALQRASKRGQQNGLQNALNQAPQAKGQPAPAPAAGDGQAQAGQQQSSEVEGGRPQIAVSDDAEFSIRSRAGRPDAAPKEISTFQRILDAGNGKQIIQIHERAGGESAGLTSPPTLTVNVQASAASPGPASPNTPHVPVSALAVHIAQQFKNGARRFDIRLDPPELGRIDVRLDVSRDGQVSTHLVVERSETLDLLQRDARQLERALQDAGLDTSKEDMKFSLKDQGLAQGDSEDRMQGEDDSDVSGRDTADEPDDMSDEAMPPPKRYGVTAGLDVRI